jgi:hypothetical protein
MSHLPEAADIFTFMTGSKMFIATINRTKEYLAAIKQKDGNVS